MNRRAFLLSGIFGVSALVAAPGYQKGVDSNRSVAVRAVLHTGETADGAVDSQETSDMVKTYSQDDTASGRVVIIRTPGTETEK